MSNSFRGKTQQMPSPMGYSGAPTSGDPYSFIGGSSSRMPTTFGNFGMGTGMSGVGAQPSLVPKAQPTVNDLFSQYFSQQYYGGDAFNPFAATSMLGGGMGKRQPFRRRQMMREQLPVMPARQETEQALPAQSDALPADLMMYAGGRPNVDMLQQLLR